MSMDQHDILYMRAKNVVSAKSRNYYMASNNHLGRDITESNRFFP